MHGHALAAAYRAGINHRRERDLVVTRAPRGPGPVKRPVKNGEIPLYAEELKRLTHDWLGIGHQILVTHAMAQSRTCLLPPQRCMNM